MNFTEETKGNAHWALGRPFTNFEKENVKVEKILNAVYFKVRKLHEVKVITDVGDLNDESRKFILPDFEALKASSPEKYYSGKTQRWIGHVLNINKKTFNSHLDDLTNPGTFELGEFDINEVSLEDRELLKVGSIFYLSAGFVTSRGQRMKEYILRFKRVVEWEEDDYDNAIDRAKYWQEKIKWDD